jgi:hypothetical protein
MRNILPLVMMLILTLSACGNRAATRQDRSSSTGEETTSQSMPQSNAAEDSGSPMVTTGLAAKAPEGQTPGGKASPAGTPPSTVRPVVVQASRSLAGHDRFLVSQPFDGTRPADFELGPLLDRTSDPESITPSLDGLAQALTGKKLETAAFSSQGLLLASLLYAPALDAAPKITRIRYSELRRLPGRSYAVALRLFSESGFAEGLAILQADEDGSWLIEQLDLDLAGLDKPVTRNELWDPYGYSRNLME